MPKTGSTIKDPIMEMPQPGEAHAQLQRLVGNWTGDETMNPSPWDPEGGPATATVNNVTGPGGFTVVQDYQQKRGGQVSLEGHAVFSVAPSGEFQMHWWDSVGTPGQIFSGTFEGDDLIITNVGEQGHSRAHFTLGDNSYQFKMEVSEDGASWYTFMEGSYTK